MKNKIYVRYDKNGRIVPTSMKFTKPKNGNWTSIDAYQCCTTTTTTTNLITTTTTTTTTLNLSNFVYNFYAATDERNIAPVGWHVPTVTDFQNLFQQTTLENLWNSGFITEQYYYVGNGVSLFSSSYLLCGVSNNSEDARYWFGVSDPPIVGCGIYFGLYGSDIGPLLPDSPFPASGLQIKYIKDNSTFVSQVEGNNGYIYNTIQFGNQIWTLENSKETKFQNGAELADYTYFDMEYEITPGYKTYI